MDAKERRISAFEFFGYVDLRKMMKISWKEKQTN